MAATREAVSDRHPNMHGFLVWRRPAAGAAARGPVRPYYTSMCTRQPREARDPLCTRLSRLSTGESSTPTDDETREARGTRLTRGSQGRRPADARERRETESRVTESAAGARLAPAAHPPRQRQRVYNSRGSQTKRVRPHRIRILEKTVGTHVTKPRVGGAVFVFGGIRLIIGI